MNVKIYQDRIQTVLETHLPNEANNVLHQAMRYSVLNGGKRLRPVLMYLIGEALNADLDKIDMPAYAIELLHCYSLIHDDLPAMDDDDLRRGKPTCHKAFDEAIAILAGDTLQAIAFQTLAKIDAKSCEILANAAIKMAEGQTLDITTMQNIQSTDALLKIYEGKTGALIQASAEMVAYVADVKDDNLIRYAKCLGLAFQIHDDVLDITSNTNELGKPAKSDEKQNKKTYPLLTSTDEAKEKTEMLLDEAMQCLIQAKLEKTSLAEFAYYVISRKY